jgi:hypothetical protein
LVPSTGMSLIRWTRSFTFENAFITTEKGRLLMAAARILRSHRRQLLCTLSTSIMGRVAPEDIQISIGDRPPRQLPRSKQRLSTATYGMSITHSTNSRIVSYRIVRRWTGERRIGSPQTGGAGYLDLFYCSSDCINDLF